MPKIELPEVVKKQVELYRKGKEKFDVFGCLIEYEGNRFYFIAYMPTGYNLIVREDGFVPPVTSIDPIIRIGIYTDTASRNIQTTCKKIYHHPGYRWMRKVKRILSDLENYIDFDCNPSEEINESYRMFYNTADVYLNKYQEIKEAMHLALKYNNQAFDYQQVDSSLCEKIIFYKDKIVECAFEQNRIQVDTYEDRKKVLAYLGSKIPFWKIGDRVKYYLLKWQHKKMHRFDKLNESEKEMHIKGVSKVKEKEKQEAEKIYQTEIMGKMRNPVDEEKTTE
ncbi:hypothetical protein SAMN04488112_1333 [Melghirimyces thermohalophilus]|uniref:Uncharacterized protein n=1 Tax=Melghirimyces thermohalophilus TaxID=1236220 RepID=A0A1G6RX01_9BACL|nr:hypothetical protein [Melghirimyces thermohalophilus]SDD09192.1 hypothetical protein SAMN04488112_1333 [Melghirimyces thermohalophilus]